MNYMHGLGLLFGISLYASAVELSIDDGMNRAARPDSPPVTSPISVVVPSLDLGAVLSTLASINCKIGNVNQDVCQDTILSVLGDACNILGISISQAIKELLDCCTTDTVDLQDILATLTNCGMPTHITQAMIPFTITQPGLYCLAEDVTIPAGDTGITINSSNVILDLNEHQIIAGFLGISTAFATLQNIIIKNGICRNQTNTNITVQGTITNIAIQNCQLISAPTNGLLVTNDSVIEMVVDGCTFAAGQGIFFNSTNGAANIRNIAIRNCIFDLNNHNAIQFVTTAIPRGINIRNCVMNDVGIGIFCLPANNVYISNCYIQNPPLISGQGIGIFNTTGAVIENCVVFGVGGPIGIELGGSSMVNINNCIVRNVTAPGAIAFFINGSSNVTVTNSEFSGSSQNVNISGNNIVLRDSTITGNITSAYAIQCVGSNINIENCQVLASNASGLGSSAPRTNVINSIFDGNGTRGIELEVGSNQSVVQNCILNNNGERGILVSSVDVVIKNCTANHNSTVGMELASTASAVVIQNCEVINNLTEGIRTAAPYTNILDSQVLTNLSNGIDLLSTSVASVVSNSTVSGNGLVGIESGSANTVIDSCAVQNNGSHGIDLAGLHMDVKKCSITNNATNGINHTTGAACSIRDSEVISNSSQGILVNGTDVILNNIVLTNGSNGINTLGAGNYIKNNIVTANGGFGIIDGFPGFNQIYNNNASNNTAGNYNGVTPVNSPGGALAGNFNDFLANVSQ